MVCAFQSLSGLGTQAPSVSITTMRYGVKLPATIQMRKWDTVLAW